MSDRDTILDKLAQAAARRRTNTALERLALGLSAWVGIAVAVKLADLAWPFPPTAIRTLWIVWVLGAAGVALWSFRIPRDLRATASELDRKTDCQDEVLSAWWFIDSQARSRSDDPDPGTGWVDLHIHHAAERIAKVDVARVYPRALPRTALPGLGALALLVGLHLAPLSFPVGLLFSEPPPAADPVTDRETLMSQIEDLLARAEALEPDGSLEEFRGLMEELRDPDLSALPGLDSDLEDLQSRLDEGNLSTTSILEGLEDMAAELMGAAETIPAAEAIAGGALDQAANALEALGEALEEGQTVGADLAEALDRAAASSRAGLEGLAEGLEDAASALGAEDNAGAGAALAQAADALRDLSDLVTSQDLRNQASEGIDSLQEALENASREAGAAGESAGEPGSQTSQGDPGGEGQGAPPEGAQSGEAQAGQGDAGPSPDGSAAGESAGTGEAGVDAGESQPGGPGTPGQPGNLQSAAGGDTGMIPAGLGFSPDQKTGLPTSLEVQLELQATEALSTLEETVETVPEEQATRREQSRLDFRNVPSELTPAQQELLSQEAIPREYRNLIREYFQAIRPPVER